MILPVLVYINTFCSRYFRKTWHRHDLAGQGNNESCTSRNFKVSYSYFKVCRSTKFSLVVGQAVLCLSHADRAVAEAEGFQLFRLLLCVCCKNNSLATIYFLYDLVQFIFDRSFQFICISESRLVLLRGEELLLQV